MSAVVAIFLARFMAPIPIAVSIVGAFVSRSWWHVAITAVAAATMSEFALGLTKPAYSFDPLAFLIGIAAAGLWASWFFWIRQGKLKSK